jgi:DnaJ-class molecular chaperone
MTEQGGAGKGDTYRRVNQKTFNDNFDAIFGKKRLNNKEESESNDTYANAQLSIDRNISVGGN